MESNTGKITMPACLKDRKHAKFSVKDIEEIKKAAANTASFFFQTLHIRVWEVSDITDTRRLAPN